MKMQIITTVDVRRRDGGLIFPHTVGDITECVEEAIVNALAEAQSKGFDHQMRDSIEIVADSDVSALPLDD